MRLHTPQHARRGAILLLLAALMMAGCSLSSAREEDEADDGPAQQPTNFVLLDTSPTGTPEPLATSTPQPTSTARPRADDGDTSGGVTIPVNNAPVIPCVPAPATWSIYTVVSGDTLTSIASRTSSSVYDLASGNCITDPSRIRVGQQLRVPRLPVQSEQVGWLSFSPVVGSANGVYTLQAGQTYTLTWNGASMSNLLAVDFILYSSSVPNGSLFIGTDALLYDGAAVQWTVPAYVNGVIVAIGKMSGTTAIRYSGDAPVTAGAPPVTAFGVVTVNPFVSRSGDAYTVNAGSTAILSWADLPLNGVTQVDFYMEIASAGSPGWTRIGTDIHMSDGVQVEVTFTPRMAGRVRATAIRPGSTLLNTARDITIFTNPVVDPPDPVVVGLVHFFPVLDTVIDTPVLEINATVSLVWAEAGNYSLTGATFYLKPPGAARINLGSDADISDGAQLLWVVDDLPDGALIYAEGTLDDASGGIVRSWETVFLTRNAPEVTAEPDA